MKRSASTTDELFAKLVGSEKVLQTARAEVASLKERAVCPDMGRTDTEETFPEAREEAKHRLVRLNITLLSSVRAEKLTRSLMTESVNAIDTVVQQLGYDDVR